jgi:hypothetical protein
MADQLPAKRVIGFERTRRSTSANYASFRVITDAASLKRRPPPRDVAIAVGERSCVVRPGRGTRWTSNPTTSSRSRPVRRSAAGSTTHGVRRVVHDRHRATLVRTVRAAIEGPVRFDPVTNDSAPAVITDRREPVNRALKAVKRVGDSGGHDLKREMVVVTTDFALCHGQSSRRG